MGTRCIISRRTLSSDGITVDRKVATDLGRGVETIKVIWDLIDAYYVQLVDNDDGRMVAATETINLLKVVNSH